MDNSIENTNTENNETTNQETTMIENEMTHEEVQMNADAEQLAAAPEGTVTEAEAPKAETKPKAPPAHLAFVAAVKAHAEALGLAYKDQKGFAQFSNAETGHKLYVAKQGKAVTRVETTLPILGQPGTHELEKPNGRITCTIDPDLGVVEGFLLMLADPTTGKIAPPKRAAKKTGEVAPVAEQASADAPAESGAIVG